MKSIHRHVTRFWSEDRSLTAFLILLDRRDLRHRADQTTGIAFGFVNNMVFSLLLLVGLLTMTRHKVLQSVSADIRCPGRRDARARLVFGVAGLEILDGLLMLALHHRLSGHRTVAGLPGRSCHGTSDPWAPWPATSFSRWFSPLPTAWSKPFSPGLLPDARCPGSGTAKYHGQLFYYFSVVTLTTAGFGDITAVNPFCADPGDDGGPHRPALPGHPDRPPGVPARGDEKGKKGRASMTPCDVDGTALGARICCLRRETMPLGREQPGADRE